MAADPTSGLIRGRCFALNPGIFPTLLHLMENTHNQMARAQKKRYGSP